jgi:hypothetical protein
VDGGNVFSVVYEGDFYEVCRSDRPLGNSTEKQGSVLI